MTLSEAHALAVHGDRDLRIAGIVRGFWASDHIVGYVNAHPLMKVELVSENEKLVTVKRAEA